MSRRAIPPSVPHGAPRSVRKSAELCCGSPLPSTVSSKLPTGVVGLVPEVSVDLRLGRGGRQAGRCAAERLAAVGRERELQHRVIGARVLAEGDQRAEVEVMVGTAVEALADRAAARHLEHRAVADRVAERATGAGLVAVGDVDDAVAVAVLGDDADDGVGVDQLDGRGRAVEQRRVGRRQVGQQLRLDRRQRRRVERVAVDHQAELQRLDRRHSRRDDALLQAQRIGPEALVAEGLEAKDLLAVGDVAGRVDDRCLCRDRAVDPGIVVATAGSDDDARRDRGDEDAERARVKVKGHGGLRCRVPPP